MKNNYDLVIIGGGPAGLTCAIYASRSGLKTIVLEKGAPGGKLNNTHKIDNYPGMEGKAGWEFSQSFLKQAQNFGAEIKGAEVTGLSNLDSKNEKKIETSSGEIYFSKTVVIATGLMPMRMEVPGYDEFFGKGISTCVVCDGAFYRGKDIIIVGGGNSATEESLFAAGIVNKVYIVNKFSSFRAEKTTLDKLSTIKNINVLHNTEPLEVLGENGRVTGMKVKDLKTNNEKIINASGIFTYIGWLPETQFINDSEILDKNKYVLSNLENNQTKFPGVYSIGDVTPKPFKQVTVAASEGTKAALSALNYINSL